MPGAGIISDRIRNNRSKKAALTRRESSTNHSYHRKCFAKMLVSGVGYKGELDSSSSSHRGVLVEVTNMDMLEMLLKSQEVDQSSNNMGLLVLEAYSNACRPCIGIKRGFERTVREHEHHALFAKFNVDKAPDLERKLGIRALPTFVFYKNGKRVDHVASSSLETLEQYIEDNL